MSGPRKRGDLVLVGFAGHGLQFEDNNGSYFCPADAHPSKPETMLALREVYDELAECGAGAKLLLVDACRDKGKRSGIDSGFQAPSGVGVLFSCSPGQFSFEAEKLKDGVFFYHVLEGLWGKAKEDDGEVTWDGLRAYVKRQVARKVPDLYEGAKQVPHSVENLADVPALVRLARPKEVTNALNMKFIYCPPGSFLMGSPPTEKGRDEDEAQHRMALP
jgi:uncharacterized caspase-like protein